MTTITLDELLNASKTIYAPQRVRHDLQRRKPSGNIQSTGNSNTVSIVAPTSVINALPSSNNNSFFEPNRSLSRFTVDQLFSPPLFNNNNFFSTTGEGIISEGNDFGEDENLSTEDTSNCNSRSLSPYSENSPSPAPRISNSGEKKIRPAIRNNYNTRGKGKKQTKSVAFAVDNPKVNNKSNENRNSEADD
ncbi:MAG: hypothetical protein LBI56_04115 [Puniceicoccales bacterium]|jgi:hypothetical protein|nr:hypothetical protein [Puniceicoccales bacterium]